VGLFIQVLRLCGRAGLLDLEHVSLDGSKVEANAPILFTEEFVPQWPSQAHSGQEHPSRRPMRYELLARQLGGRGVLIPISARV
jgi:hypothetical protein